MSNSAAGRVGLEMKGVEAMLTLLFFSFASLALTLLQETTGSDFNDLGKKLLEGFALAVVVAIAYTFIKIRRRDRNPPAGFISITAVPAKDLTAKSADTSVQD